MKMKDQQEKIRSALESWENIERESASLIEEVKGKCSNPLICFMMDVLENDARTHTRMMEIVRDSMEREQFAFSVDEIGEIIGLIRKHIELKSHHVQVVEDVLENVTDKSLRLQTSLLKGLLADENKHREMLAGMEKVRATLYPYWAH
jgi:hypothetical protein